MFTVISVGQETRARGVCRGGQYVLDSYSVGKCLTDGGETCHVTRVFLWCRDGHFYPLEAVVLFLVPMQGFWLLLPLDTASSAIMEESRLVVEQCLVHSWEENLWFRLNLGKSRGEGSELT